MESAALNTIKRTFEDVLGSPVQEGNSIRILKNGKEIFPSMLSAIQNTRHTIEFLTFVYWEGRIAERFADALSKKAREGVSVRVILDAFGCRRMPAQLVRRMQDSGVDIEWFRPLVRWKMWKSDHRTHRKILVCDRRVAFTGGVGIADEWDGDAKDASEWRDTHFKVEGPAVSGILSGFVGNWLECGRQISELHDFKHTTKIEHRGDSAVMVLRSPAAYGWTDFTTLVRLMISIASKQIYITTAYFNPDRAAIKLLTAASRSGVQIKILVPGKHTDQKIARIAGESKYGLLLASGISILHFRPTMLHAKIISVDSRMACIGSPNFNQRSMRKDDELGLAVFDPKIVSCLDSHFREDARRAAAVELADWENRGILKKLLERLVLPFEKEI